MKLSEQQQFNIIKKEPNQMFDICSKCNEVELYGKMQELNEIDFDLMNDNELVLICLKYKLLSKDEIRNKTRKEILLIIKSFIQKKLQTYGQKKQKTI